MSRARRLLVLSVLAVPLSQVGHSLASLARDGSPLAPGGRHGYFGVALELSATLVAGTFLAALLAVVLARRPGRPLRGRGWPLAWVFLGLSAFQLELYLIQELIEGSSTIDVALRGLAGQLPVAAAAAVAVHWLSGRLRPALRRLRHRLLAVIVQLIPAPDRWEFTLPPPLRVARDGGLAGPRAPPALPAFQLV